jgi:hypothetical protein
VRYRGIEIDPAKIKAILPRTKCLLQKILRNFTHSKGDWLTSGDAFLIYLEGFHHLHTKLTKKDIPLHMGSIMSKGIRGLETISAASTRARGTHSRETSHIVYNSSGGFSRCPSSTGK